MQVIEPVEDYLHLMKEIFNFRELRRLLGRPDFTATFDAMHGVSGPYAKRIFLEASFSN